VNFRGNVYKDIFFFVSVLIFQTILSYLGFENAKEVLYKLRITRLKS